jgi:hypothetical protein
MARTSTETAVVQHTVTPAQENNVSQMVDAANHLTIGQAAVMDSFDAIKMLGRMEAMQFIATVAEKTQVEIFLHFKQGKKYKGLPYKTENGEIATVAHLEEFCQAFLGKSNRRLQELVANYHTIGPDLYEQAERLGFRQRDYNALKALPAEDRQIIAQAIESEDLDKALDLMGHMAARHHRDKETSDKRLTEAQQSLEAKDQVIADKTRELNKKAEQLARLENNRRKEVAEQEMPGTTQLMQLQEYARNVTAKIEATLRSQIVQLYIEFHNEPPRHIQLAAAQALGLIITAAYGVANDLALDPSTEPETAANDPAKADAEAFQQWQAQQSGK